MIHDTADVAESKKGMPTRYLILLIIFREILIVL